MPIFETFRETLEQVHSAHLVRPTCDNLYYEVAILQNFLEFLVTNDFPISLSLEMNPRYDVSMPTEGEKNVYGTLPAIRRARKAFIQNAMDATLTARHGHGLDQWYRDYFSDELSTAISWGFLLRDVMVRSENRFHCLRLTYCSNSALTTGDGLSNIAY